MLCIASPQSLSPSTEPAAVDICALGMQIRAQLAAEGFPLYGDTLYGPLALSTSQQARPNTCCKWLDSGEYTIAGTIR